ncbi:hypothetical protein HMPREF9996_02055 [Aggregatibacter actinomycetemcomitans Y4]|nr:hypothetical protein CF65_03002 [Aggregatibacter actinomycetemcomitans HK1651]EKX93980.1 hypothetical protein HMPREF9996_02055 [Aggregatibacter actinomycetemcomitans Y4]
MKRNPEAIRGFIFSKRRKKRPHFSFLAIPMLFRYNPPVKFNDFL